jgi:hypothetical protein
MDLMALVGLLSVAHHIPGRIRLQVERRQEALACGLSQEDVDRFAAALRQLDGITRVSLNNLALSCTIDYDPGRIPPEAWQDLWLPAEEARMLRDLRLALEPGQ